MTTNTTCLLACLFVTCLSVPSFARKARTISFVPDPSCQSNRLVGELEAALGEHLKIREIVVTKTNRAKANILVQYFLLVRTKADQVKVQLDGKAFDNQSGKLLAEGSVSSDAHPDDPAGRKAAVRQVGELLAQSLSASLTGVLWAKGKGRRVMLQITLETGVELSSDEVLARLSQSLEGSRLNLKGSTGRNLVVVFRTSERKKQLVEIIEEALTGVDQLRVTWVVQSSRSLLLKLGRQER